MIHYPRLCAKTIANYKKIVILRLRSRVKGSPKVPSFSYNLAVSTVNYLKFTYNFLSVLSFDFARSVLTSALYPSAIVKIFYCS